MAIVKAFDTSRHNHKLTREYPEGAPIDFAQAYAGDYRIWIGRAAVGNYYIDPWFQRDFDAARAAGFISLAYFVSTPEYPDNEQFDKFLQALGWRIPDGIVLDAELSRGQTKFRVTACNQYLADRFELMLPGRILLYTNQDFGNNYLSNGLGLPLFISNPGPGNGMNPNPEPSLPGWAAGYFAWQKSWEHAIPGVPDPTTDYSEFQMSEAEAREYFWMNDEEEEEEMTIDQKLDEILANQDTILETLGLIVALVDRPADEPPVDPPTPPEPEYEVLVTVDKANARFVKSWKENKKTKRLVPIMEIYPSDNSLVRDRIQFKEGDRLPVDPDIVVADGGADYFMLLTPAGRGGEELYIRYKDCEEMW